jgi:asparagine synthase (glutamine-hydrolysing)
MCGITGCYRQVGGRKLTDIMTVRIAHGGPEVSGVRNHEDDWVSVRLGHRRLSIIDLSAAADQPLAKDGLIIVYHRYGSCSRSSCGTATCGPWA